MPKRVAINISLPSAEFKEEVKRISERLKTDPSTEFVKLFRKLAKREEKHIRPCFDA